MKFGNFGREVRVSLSSTGVRAGYWHGVLRPHLAEQVELSGLPPAAERSRWQPAMDGLQSLLAGRQWAAQRLHADVGDEFVRYTVLTGLDPRLGTEEIANLAQAMFLRTFGDAAGDWLVRVSLAGSGTVVAAAIERAFVDALGALASERRMQLATVQPMFAERLSTAAFALKGAAWLVVREPGASVLALCEQGMVRSLRVLRGAGFGADDIFLALEREQRRGGSAVRSVAILGAAEWANAFSSGWQVQVLEREDTAARIVPTQAVLNGAGE